MQSQTLVRFSRGRSVATHCWYCWDCKVDRHVAPLRPQLSEAARSRGWRFWLGGGRTQHVVAA
jgi:hypothetical protein